MSTGTTITVELYAIIILLILIFTALLGIAGHLDRISDKMGGRR